MSSNPDNAREHAAHLVSTMGVRAAAREIGVATGTLARVIGGLPIQRGTRALVELHAREESSDEPSGEAEA